MFQIREDHMREFDALAGSNFEDRALRHLRKCLAAEASSFSDPELRDKIRRAMARCPSYGLTGERHIVSFVDTGLLIGEYFDRDPNYPWAKQILEDRKVSPSDRARAILEIAIEIRRDEVRILKSVPASRRANLFVDLSQEGF
jgi:hypothetical protein